MPHKKQPGMHAQNLPEHPRLFLFVQAEKQPFHLSAHQRIKEVHPMASTSIREVTSQATLDEKKKLRKEFNYFDMIFYTIAALVGIDTLGAVSSLGSQALTWLLISAVTFLLPYGLLTAELGSTFTQEGGMYEWCKLAGGRFFASFGAMLYWISNPLWVGDPV